MITFDEALMTVSGLDADQLNMWIEQRWIVPTHHCEGYQFSDIDIARLRLVHDILYTLEVELESVSLVLSLLDQVYATRRQMHKLADAVAAQPDDVRRAIFERLDQLNEQNASGR